MKIIHAADIHLGSKMDSRFPKEIAEKRNVAELVAVDGRAAGAVAWNRETKEFETYLAENLAFRLV